MMHMPTQRGFTLIETLMAVSLLTVTIVAPMSLATQSLASAYYARDQITASYLAQEAIEVVRASRDGNILHNAQGNTPVNLLADIPDPTLTGQPFTVDARTNEMDLCPGGVCPALQSDRLLLYGYDPSYTNTNFTRSVTAQYVTGTTDEVKVTATVSWRTGKYSARSISISENLYRWVNDGSATP